MSELSRATIANIVTAGARIVIVFATTPLLVRILGLEGFGTWTALLTINAVALSLDLGISGTAAALLAEAVSSPDPTVKYKVLRSGFLLLSAAGALVTCLWVCESRPVLAFLLGAAPSQDVERASMILAAGLLSRFYQSILGAWQSAHLRADLASYVEAVTFILQNIGIVALAMLSHPYVLMAIWMVISSALALALHIGFAVGGPRKKLFLSVAGARFRSDTTRKILIVSLGQWLSGLGAVAFSKLDRVIISHTMGLNNLAMYAAATSYASKSNELAATVVAPFVPFWSNALARRAGHEARHLLISAMKLNAFAVASTTMVLCVGAQWLARLIVTRNVELQTAAIVAAALAYGLYSLATVGYFACITTGRTMQNAVAITAGAVVALVLMYWAGARGHLALACFANAGFALLWASVAWAAQAFEVTVAETALAFAPQVLLCGAIVGITNGALSSTGTLVRGGLLMIGLAAALWIARPALLWVLGRRRAETAVRA